MAIARVIGCDLQSIGDGVRIPRAASLQTMRQGRVRSEGRRAPPRPLRHGKGSQNMRSLQRQTLSKRQRHWQQACSGHDFVHAEKCRVLSDILIRKNRGKQRGRERMPPVSVKYCARVIPAISLCFSNGIARLTRHIARLHNHTNAANHAKQKHQVFCVEKKQKYIH